MATPEVYRESFITLPDYRYRISENDGGMVCIQYQEAVSIDGIRQWATPPNTPPLSGCREDMAALAAELLQYVKEMPE